MALAYAAGKPLGSSSVAPNQLCVDLADGPQLDTTDLGLLRGNGIPVSQGGRDCFHSAEPPAAWFVSGVTFRWWDTDDEYEVYCIRAYHLETQADLEFDSWLLVAVHRDDGWRILREEAAPLPVYY